MGAVGVFPAQIEDASVLHHHRVPVAVLLEGQAADSLAVALHPVEVCHVGFAAHAGDALVRSRRGEDDASVRQVAGVVVVDVGPHVGRDDARLAAGLARLRVDPKLEEPVPLGVAGGGRQLAPVDERSEEHPVGVEVEVDIADELARRRLEDRRDGPVERHHRERVVVDADLGLALELLVELDVLGVLHRGLMELLLQACMLLDRRDVPQHLLPLPAVPLRLVGLGLLKLLRGAADTPLRPVPLVVELLERLVLPPQLADDASDITVGERPALAFAVRPGLPVGGIALAAPVDLNQEDLVE
ncbi:MAG: hypothetical protein ACYS9X_30370, partial [Planctomycetota bacterium]